MINMHYHKFPWKWYLKDIDNVYKNGLNVFSCFACGGGSSLGYKLAGYNVLGCVEIDPNIAKVYKLNLHPKYQFVMDVRDFLALDNSDIPNELFNLDILDGSSPCTTFSLSGQREKTWRKEKKFAEGQVKQRLDDLFFVFIDIVNKLRPKVVVAENVKGIICGIAKVYANEVFNKLKSIGYEVQAFLLNAATMGVPQKRERVFFIARRKDLNLPEVQFNFDEKPILFGEVRSKYGRKCEGLYADLVKKRMPCDKCIADILVRLGEKHRAFNHMIVKDEEVCNVITNSCLKNLYRYYDGMRLSIDDVINCSTFPQDYKFTKSITQIQFICGMSVPPVMMANIADQIRMQLFNH